MNTNERISDNDERQPDDHGHGGDSMMGMMAMMTAMCVGILLLFAIVPAVGLPFGILVALGGGAMMVFLHGRFMRHG